MAQSPTPRVRRSLADVQADYDSGKDQRPLEDLVRGWHGIQQLCPDDAGSFFVIGGYHGEPFRGAGWGDSTYWGGYCHHGNVLFPLWHRMYLLVLERALRSIPGCEDVSLPFWDECSADSLANGIPHVLTDETFVLDGQEISNPLHCYILPRTIGDHLAVENGVTTGDLYTKQEGYQTVRYPYSGLVGTKHAQGVTKEHNEQWPHYGDSIGPLNDNVKNWLNHEITVDGQHVRIATGSRGLWMFAQSQ